MKRRDERAGEPMVVVITGASSGIGRATAHLFAKEGAKLILAARDEEALVEAARECDRLGGEAYAFPTDVTDEGAVQRLRDATVDRFGRIDVWVNDAAVYAMGPFEETPTDVFRRVIETNVFGYVYGARAALSEFRKRDKGVLINVGSVAGKVSYADASAYCASKHAVHAITEALRQELVGTNIHACVVAPATVDTPLFQHSANFTGREVEAMRPIYAPERVAAAIVRCAHRPRREVLVGSAPRAMTLMRRLAPPLFERMQPKMIESDHLGDASAPPSRGNLDRSRAPHALHGGWKERKSSRTKAPAIGAALLLVPALFVGYRALKAA